MTHGGGVAGRVAQRRRTRSPFCSTGNASTSRGARGAHRSRLQEVESGGDVNPAPRRRARATSTYSSTWWGISRLPGPARDDRDAERHPEDGAVGRARHAAEPRRRPGGLAHAAHHRAHQRLASLDPRGQAKAVDRLPLDRRPRARASMARWQATSISAAIASSSGPGVSRMSSVACGAPRESRWTAARPAPAPARSSGSPSGGRRWRLRAHSRRSRRSSAGTSRSKRAERADRDSRRPRASRREPCGRAPSPGPTPRRAARDTARSARARR